MAHDATAPSASTFSRVTPGLAAEVARYAAPPTRGDGVRARLNPDWDEWLMCWPVGWTDPARAGGIAWLDPSRDPADLPPHDPGFVPRVTSRRQYRAPRLRAIGNGQFPPTACVMSERGFALLDAMEGPR